MALTAQVDYGTVAVQSTSDVVFSTPLAFPNATYSLTYGDGQSGQMFPPIGLSTVVRAGHAYSSSGTFTTSLTVTDASGNRIATGSASITVRSLDGRWSNSSFNSTTNRAETRTFQLSQTGSQLSGSYADLNGVSQPVTGKLSSPRSISLAVAGKTIAFGTDLDGTGIGDDANAFTVIFSSGPSGQKLTFNRQR